MGPMGLMGMSRRVPEGASFSRLRSGTELPTTERKASSGKLSSSSSSNPAARNDGVLE
jgi:hypothetical protein